MDNEFTYEELLAGKYSELYNKTLSDGHIFNPRIDRRYLVIQMYTTATDYAGYPYKFFKEKIEWASDQALFAMDNMNWRFYTRDKLDYKMIEMISFVRKYVPRIIRTAITLEHNWDGLADIYKSGPLCDLFNNKKRKKDLSEWLDAVAVTKRNGEGYSIHPDAWPEEYRQYADYILNDAALNDPDIKYWKGAVYNCWDSAFEKLMDFMCIYCRYLTLLNLKNYTEHWENWTQTHNCPTPNLPFTEKMLNLLTNWSSVEETLSAGVVKIALGFKS